MNILLGDEVTIQREIGSDITFVTGRISGVVLNDHGELRYFYLKGIDSAFWLNEGWKFQDDWEDEGEEDNG